MKKIILALLVLVLFVSCQEFSKSGSGSYDSVVFIGVDGAGHFFDDDSIEGFEEIFENYALGYENTCETPSISAQNWASFLHGVSPETHKCVNGSIACERFPYAKYPSIFKIIRKVFPDAELCSFSEWNAINYGLIETSARVNKSSDIRFCSTVHTTAEIMEMTIKQLENKTPKLLFVHLEDVDEAGHAYGYGSEKYLEAIQNDVDFIKQVDGLIDYDKTLFIVATDHGGLNDDHGGDSEQEMKITIAIKGKTVNQMELTSCTPKDIAAVVLEALGINIPSNFEGEVPEGLTL